jgi:hypothetical protein
MQHVEVMLYFGTPMRMGNALTATRRQRGKPSQLRADRTAQTYQTLEGLR